MGGKTGLNRGQPPVRTGPFRASTSRYSELRSPSGAQGRCRPRGQGAQLRSPGCVGMQEPPFTDRRARSDPAASRAAAGQGQRLRGAAAAREGGPRVAVSGVDMWACVAGCTRCTRVAPGEARWPGPVVLLHGQPRRKTCERPWRVCEAWREGRVHVFITAPRARRAFPRQRAACCALRSPSRRQGRCRPRGQGAQGRSPARGHARAPVHGPPRALRPRRFARRGRAGTEAAGRGGGARRRAQSRGGWGGQVGVCGWLHPLHARRTWGGTQTWPGGPPGRAA